MKKQIINIRPKVTIGCIAFIVIFFLVSCEKFVDIGAPDTEVGMKQAFETDASATSAVLGIYVSARGNVKCYTACPGNSADELQSTEAGFSTFYNNVLPVNSFYVELNLWRKSYEIILQANNAIEGISQSNTLTPSVKKQLLGETKFLRAFTYFYLVNMFGDVPMPLGADVITNASLPRTSTLTVYDQIVVDLKAAKELLGESYPLSGYRTRIDKSVADALLARVYLYRKDWVNAEIEATAVIENPDYSLADLDGVFINSSREIILQLSNTTGCSTFGSMYLAEEGFIPGFCLTDTLYKSFSNNDIRRDKWVKKITVSDNAFYSITKYKVRAGSGNEYDVVMRLAEQYLIRAEARAHIGKITGENSAETDLNTIRNRAGLDNTDVLDQASMLLAIENERKLELFGEWGHRWFDLKRWPSRNNPSQARADDVLSGIKKEWTSTAVLYPIPQSQRLLNTNLTQNPGYGD